jgi:hypothetical protein
MVLFCYYQSCCRLITIFGLRRWLTATLRHHLAAYYPIRHHDGAGHAAYAQ